MSTSSVLCWWRQASAGLQCRPESITADRCRAKLSRQWVPHNRGRHKETPCSQLRPRSRNEHVEQNEDWTSQCCQTREYRRAWNTSAPCSEHSQKPAKRHWTEFCWRPATSEAHRVELVWCVRTSQCGQQNVRQHSLCRRRLLHGKIGILEGFFGPSSVHGGRTHIVLGWNM